MSYNALKDTWIDNKITHESFISSHKPIKICVLGGHQVGSTRLFNLVRLSYEKIGKKVLSLAPKERPDRKQLSKMSRHYDVVLHKFHDVDIDYIKTYDIILLPVRNLLDAALSAGIRWNKNSKNEYIRHCYKNIQRFNKFKSVATHIFKYEDYSVNSIIELCKVMNINIYISVIISIMKELEDLLHSETNTLTDDLTNSEYKKTLLSQHHNTSGGKSNKFIDVPASILQYILDDKHIINFMKEHKYF
jgi:hypothetical protein